MKVTRKIGIYVVEFGSKNWRWLLIADSAMLSANARAYNSCLITNWFQVFLQHPGLGCFSSSEKEYKRSVNNFLLTKQVKL